MKTTHRRLVTHGQLTNRVPTPSTRNTTYIKRLVIKGREQIRITTPSSTVTTTTITTNTNLNGDLVNTRKVITIILVHYSNTTIYAITDDHCLHYPVWLPSQSQTCQK
jgi:hypothetical protein